MADPSWGGGVSSYWHATGASSAISRAGSQGDDAGINAGLRYDQDSASLSDLEVDEKAREAREAIDSPEGERLRQAEQIGKSRRKA